MPEEGFEKFKPFMLKNMIQDGDKSVFRLPRNQRKYAWGDKHRIEMWDDLQRFREHAIADDRYYFGNIVTAVEKDLDGDYDFVKEMHGADNTHYDRAELFDGQQRMVTITILAAAIRDVCLEMVHYREEHDRMRLDGFDGTTGKTIAEEYAEAIGQGLIAAEYYQSYQDDLEATAAADQEAQNADFDGRTGKSPAEEYAEATENEKTPEEYYQPHERREVQDQEALDADFDGRTGKRPHIERGQAERAEQTPEEYYQPHDEALAAAAAADEEARDADFDGRTGKSPAAEHIEANSAGQDCKEYYRSHILKEFPKKISQDPSMNQARLDSMKRYANRIDQDVIKSSEGLDEMDFDEEGSGLDARIRYLELTGRQRDDERLTWVQLKRDEREYHYRDENPETGYKPNAGNANIYNCYDYFFKQCRREIQRKILYDDELEPLPQINNPRNVVKDFYKDIFEKTIFTEARVIGGGNAYRIFGTLNDRGIDLFETDKLRNTVMSKVMELARAEAITPEDEAAINQELEDAWEIIWDKDKNADNILRYWYNASRDDVKEVLSLEGELELPRTATPIRASNNPLKLSDGSKIEVSLHRIIETALMERSKLEGQNYGVNAYVNFAKEFARIIRLGDEHARNDFSWALRVTDSRVQTVIEYAILNRKYHINENLDQNEGFSQLTDEQIKTIKRIVLSYSLALWKPFPMLIDGEGATGIFQRWARLITHTKNPADVITTMRRDCRAYMEDKYTAAGMDIKEGVIQRISGKKWEKNDSAKSLLYSIEEHLRVQDEGRLHEPNVLDLEHILPQSAVNEDPDDNAQWWINHVGVEPDELERLVYSIGNMTLLHNRTNRSVGNKKFCFEDGDPAPADDIPDGINFIEVEDGEGYFEKEELDREGNNVIKQHFSHKRAAIRSSNLRINNGISGENHPHILEHMAEEDLTDMDRMQLAEPEPEPAQPEPEPEPEGDPEPFDFTEWKGNYEFNRWKGAEIRARNVALAEKAWDMMRLALDLPDEEEE